MRIEIIGTKISEMIRNDVRSLCEMGNKSRIIKTIFSELHDLKGLLKFYVRHKKRQVHARKYHFLPLEDKIVFANFNGRGYGCNPKYIAQEIIAQNLPYELVWLVSENDKSMPDRIRQVKITSEDSFRELATAKVIINNVKGDLNFKKRKDQYYIQTWHAGYSFKYLERDAADKLSKEYLLGSRYNSIDTDLFLSNSIIQSEEYRRAFWCKCEILEAGLPRNDLFFKSDFECKKKVRELLNIEDGSHVVLYAPTFRTCNDDVKVYGLDFKRVLNSLQNRFGGNWLLLVRLHPNIVQDSIKLEAAIDVSNYPDMQELLLISDVLVTDYSTSMFDMTEMNKKVFLFSNDIEEYQSLRGLKRSYFELPIPISKNNDELEKNINSFDADLYEEVLIDINKIYATYDSGNAAFAVVDKIKKWMK